jgi:hypothetical protein
MALAAALISTKMVITRESGEEKKVTECQIINRRRKRERGKSSRGRGEEKSMFEVCKEAIQVLYESCSEFSNSFA